VIRTRIRRGAASLVAGAALVASCSSTTGTTNDLEYVDELAAICAATASQLDALRAPPDATTAEFGAAVAELVGEQSEQLRQLDVPDESIDTHRDFVLVTDEQAAAWQRLAETSPDELSEITAELSSLTLTRDDLAASLGVPSCRSDG
jgi:antitoxin component HigA of HigAB toxin-antitoxin module